MVEGKLGWWLLSGFIWPRAEQLKMEAVRSAETYLPTSPHGVTTQKTNIELIKMFLLARVSCPNGTFVY
jgi:hypothetical protein